MNIITAQKLTNLAQEILHAMGDLPAVQVMLHSYKKGLSPGFTIVAKEKQIVLYVKTPGRLFKKSDDIFVGHYGVGDQSIKSLSRSLKKILALMPKNKIAAIKTYIEKGKHTVTVKMGSNFAKGILVISKK